MRKSAINSDSPHATNIVAPTLNESPRSYPIVWSLISLNVAVFLALPIFFKNNYPFHPENFGADWGPLTFSGQWWRLLTSSFIHVELLHLSSNMFALWILGKRIESLMGHWMFLLFYLGCGVVGNFVVLASHPEVISYDASLCIMSIAGALIVAYGLRFISLSWSARGKLALLTLCCAFGVGMELSRKTFYPHTTGLFTGMVFGTFVIFFSKRTRSKFWTFAP
jgi:rhomboid protease GluP